MENENNKTALSNLLLQKETEELFAELDYMLKDGVHIQGIGSQARYFNYIKYNEDALIYYYKSLFRVELVSGGDEERKYYYLDFSGSNRGKISERHRHILKSEFVIIGFIIYKIVYIDRQIDLNSVKKLKEKIRIDYEEYKPGIYRLIAKSKNTGPGNINDENVDITIQSALNEFRKIGWITMDKDEFDLLPAFDRLIKVYEEYIQNLDETLNELK